MPVECLQGGIPFLIVMQLKRSLGGEDAYPLRMQLEPDTELQMLDRPSPEQQKRGLLT